MARSGDPERNETWGTWEELLLACAVSRHGTRSWDSVATEIRSRISPSDGLTPQGCRQRYLTIHRRFATIPGGGAAAINDDDEAELPPDVSWVEELRKLRLAELRRELERRDRSIGSLQLKVKRLQEEREIETQFGGGNPDQKKGETPSSSSTPATVAGDRVSRKDDGPSCGESNSTDPMQNENLKDDRTKTEAAARPCCEASVPSDLSEKTAAAAAGEVSCNGSTEGAAEQAAQPQVGESVESIAESKGGEVEKQTEREEVSSDVQSSASLSRQKRGLRKEAASGGGGSSGGEGQEAVGEEVSIASAAESRPLISFLEIIRSDKYGSVFERPLESQETAKYRSIIRRHVDLEILRGKLRRSRESSYGANELFRDLLLLCANAIVFYPRDSHESIAAGHLREMVLKEMAATSRPPKPKPRPPHLKAAPPPPPPPTTTTTAAQSQPISQRPKPELDLAGALLVKPTPKAPLIACRKRSSISNKAAAAAVVAKEEDKSESDRKDSDHEENKDRFLAKKKAGKYKSFISGAARGLRTNKSRGSNGSAGASKRLNLAPTPNVKPRLLENTGAAETSTKAEKKSNCGGGSSGSGGAATSAVPATKKQGAATFLNRMKRSLNGTQIESLKASSPGNGIGRKGAEQKNRKGDGGRKDQGSRQGGSGSGSGSAKKVEDPSGSGKRNVGRPPKRAAPSPTPPTAKRAREEAKKPDPAAKAASSLATRKRGRSDGGARAARRVV